MTARTGGLRSATIRPIDGACAEPPVQTTAWLDDFAGFVDRLAPEAVWAEESDSPGSPP